MRHIFCLRHLLVSLKKSKFKSQISKLVSVVSNKDYDELKHEYETNWKTLDIDDVNELNKYLSKIGLVFKDKKIKVSDSFRWENCSMQKRAAFKMPSCTNQIESGHGHLNAAIPRRNRFFSSIKRLIDGIIKRNKNYFINFHQHYANYKRKIRNIIKAISDEIMTSAIQHYETDPEKQICKCGESILISSEMDVHIPCSHLLHFGIEFPEIEAPKLKYKNTFQGELIFEYNINSTPKIQIDTDYFVRIKENESGSYDKIYFVI